MLLCHSDVVSFTIATRLQRPSQNLQIFLVHVKKHGTYREIHSPTSLRQSYKNKDRSHSKIRFTAKLDQDNVKYPSCGFFIVSNWAEDEPEYYDMENVDSAMGLSKKRHFLGGVPLFVINLCLLLIAEHSSSNSPV